MRIRMYAAQNNKDDIREQSSSGAVFYELAVRVIKENGVVFGARFDKDWNVVHGHTETYDGVIQLLGSKYVQSRIGNEYQFVEKYLSDERLVLFSGTPCQIAGLKAFLGRDYKNLITVDFFCHGVPSAAVWRKYLSQVSRGHKVKKINFRDKTEGWKKYSLRIDGNKQVIYQKNQEKDLYITGFRNDIFLRPSCYECRFKGIQRISDITLADYWGIEMVYPEMYDGMGTSLVLVQSAKGEKYWENIVSEFEVIEVDATEHIDKYNCAAVSSVKRPKERERFYKKNWDRNITNYLTRVFLKRKIFNKIKKIVEKG